MRVLTKAEKREKQEIENENYGTNDSTSTGPKSTSSSGSPPVHEDLASDYSVSPSSEKTERPREN